MKTELLSHIVDQVRYNCNISDAKYSGMFSTCGLLLRLRDLYRWEAGLELRAGVDPALIGQWLDEREERWLQVVDEEGFRQIEINDRKYDAFDTEGLNHLLEPAGFLYGAGYSGGMKPSFFLAQLEKKGELEGCFVHIVGKELARDLLAAPAQLQEKKIFVRKQVIHFLIWDKVDDIEKSGREAARYALHQYGLSTPDLDTRSQKWQENLDEIVDHELDSYIYHEIGEASDDVFDTDVWKEIIRTFPHSRVEIFARVVKDVLADTNEKGRLKFIIDNRKVSSLYFFFAFLSGFAKLVLPEITDISYAFKEEQDWKRLDRFRREKYARMKTLAEELMEIFSHTGMRGEDWVRHEIENRLIGPLGA